MKNSTLKHWILFVLLCGSAVAARAQGTAFTYQGRLNDGPLLANGLYDVKFLLFDSPTSGDFAGPLTNSAVAVSNGLFTVLLDFGPDVFNGHPNFFLEIGVRAAGGGEFTTLNPRQPVTPSPYAIHADSATKLFNGAVTRLNNLTDNVMLAAGQNVTITPSGNTLTIGASGINPWQANGSAISYNAGNVGIGISAPNAPLHIAKPVPVLALQDADSLSTQVGLVSFRNSGGAETAWLGFGSSGNADATFMNNRTGGRTALGAGGLERLTVTSSGDAGIGTTTPQAKLEVRGDIRLGASGQFRATSGEENLRIVRGIVAPNGNIVAGSGFTVTRSGPGDYLISFTTPFASPPALTATQESDLIIPAFVAADNVAAGSGNVVIRRYSTFDEIYFLSDSSFHFTAIGPR